MNESKGTPWPWAVTLGGDVKQEHGLMIARLTKSRGEQSRINAAPIAAATDLLNALRTLADAAESRGIPCDAARAAIAKALGKDSEVAK